MTTISSYLQGYNFNRKSELICLDMIYLTIQIRIPESKIKFNIPRVMDIRPDIDDDPNTFINVVVDRLFDKRIAGNQGFMYRRLPLDYITQDTSIKIKPSQYPFKVSDVLNQINASLNSNLTMQDLLDLTYVGDESEIVLVTNPDSLAWIGTKTVQIKPNAVLPIVTVQDLSGFVAYTGP